MNYSLFHFSVRWLALFLSGLFFRCCFFGCRFFGGFGFCLFCSGFCLGCGGFLGCYSSSFSLFDFGFGLKANLSCTAGF